MVPNLQVETVLQLHRDRNDLFVVGALDFFRGTGEMAVLADCFGRCTVWSLESMKFSAAIQP